MIKKLFFKLLLILVVIAFIPINQCLASVENEIITIPDENLKKSIYNMLRKNYDSPLFKKEMESLESLYFISSDVSDLTGLNYAINLKNLKIGNNKISDYRILGELKKLEQLVIEDYDSEGGEIEDIEWISSLTNMVRFEANSNKIRDLAPLSNLSNLKIISLYGNQIEDISVLGQLSQLEKLNLNFNRITDISVIGRLSNLEEVSIESQNILYDVDEFPINGLLKIDNPLKNSKGNYIIPEVIESKDNKLIELDWRRVGNKLETNLYFKEDYFSGNIYIHIVEPIVKVDNSILCDLQQKLGRADCSLPITEKNMSYLKEYSITKNNLDFNFLKYATKIEKLSFVTDEVDVKIIEPLKTLKSLSISGKDIKNIELIKKLKNLEQLVLETNIENVDFLTSLSKLKDLSIVSDQLSNIEGVRNLINLNNLSLKSNSIKDVGMIGKLVGLEHLWLDADKIVNINGLNDAINLKACYIKSTNLENIKGLTGLHKLETLSILTDKELLKIDSLSTLEGLKTLSISSGGIKSLQALRNMQQLEQLDLSGNNLSNKDLEYIKGLKNIFLLNLSKNNISDISVLSNLINLMYFDISSNNINDLSIVKKLPNLNVIEFNNCNISDISPLNGTSISWSGVNQVIELDPVYIKNGIVEVKNPLRALDGWVIEPSRMEPNGIKKDYYTLKFSNLSQTIDLKIDFEIEYWDWSHKVFSGTIIQPALVQGAFPIIKLTDFKADSKSITLGNSTTFIASSSFNSAVYEFYVYENEEWVKKQTYSSKNTFTYQPKKEGVYKVRVRAKHKDSTKDYDDFKDLTITVEKPGTDAHIKRVSYFRAENGKLYLDGYSYVKGVNIPNKSDIIQKLKFVDINTGKQVKTYELPNYYSTAASKDPNHGNGIYNYDWAKFKGHLDVSDLPVGDYYIKIYTNAKKNAYDEIIEFHSSIGDFSFQTNGKDYQFVREGNTLRLSVEAVQPEQPEQPEQPTPPVTQENPHVKRVSYFRAENGQLYLDGYSYVKGINIPNQSDIIQKLKFVDVNTGKQVKTYELPNFYSTAASKDPNHGAGIYNYDWAKFKGYLDVSDLPSGEYYLKIYTNAKKNAYDEIIAFHSSIGDFSFESSGKLFNFERLDVNGVGTLKLVVSEITTIEEDETMTIVDEELAEEDEEIQVEIKQPGEDFNSDIENEIESLEVNEQASDIESDLNHI